MIEKACVRARMCALFTPLCGANTDESGDSALVIQHAELLQDSGKQSICIASRGTCEVVSCPTRAIRRAIGAMSCKAFLGRKAIEVYLARQYSNRVCLNTQKKAV